MGLIIHHAIIVSGDSGHIEKAHKLALEICDPTGKDGYVMPIGAYLMNGTATFVIPPDGGKEGWEESEKCEANRNRFIEELKKREREIQVDWVEVQFGGDYPEDACVTRHNYGDDA